MMQVSSSRSAACSRPLSASSAPRRTETLTSSVTTCSVSRMGLSWFPGQQTYRELVSCSNCTDYQARGVGVRCGAKKANEKSDMTARASYCHMLNATLCATGRGICCILENYQTEEGVVVPEVLRPYMGGKDFMPFVRGPPELTKGEKNKGKNKGKK